MGIHVAMVGLRAPTAEGGIERVVAETSRRLVARGCRVTVYCRGRWNDRGSEFEGVELVDVPTIYRKHTETAIYTALALPAAMGLLPGHDRPDVLHLHAVGPGALAPLPALAGLPTVVTAHGLDFQREKWGRTAQWALAVGARAAARHAHALTAVSAHTAQWFEDQGHRVWLTPNGVELPEPVPLEAAGIEGLQPGYFLHIGRLVPEKRIERAIAAHNRAATARPLLIVGAPSHTEAYAQRLRKMAGPDVHFLGHQSGPAKHALIQHAGAVLFPSRLEGMPLTLLEAMAARRTCIVSPIAPHLEVVHDGYTAHVVHDDTVEAWATALRAASNAAPAMGSRARDHVAQHHSWDHTVDTLLDVYHRCIGSRALAGTSATP